MNAADLVCEVFMRRAKEFLDKPIRLDWWDGSAPLPDPNFTPTRPVQFNVDTLVWSDEERRYVRVGRA